MNAQWTRRALCAVVLGATAWLALAAQDGTPRDLVEKLSYPRTIAVVRHAEKAAEPKNDPGLSEDGLARAERLAKHFAKAGVTHLFATEFQRTQQTLAPLSLATGVTVTIGKAADAAALESALVSLPRGSVAVVAAHSNTVPAIVGALTGGRAKFKLEETDYDRLYVVTQWGPLEQSTLLELRF